jgi:hypothetical protein
MDNVHLPLKIRNISWIQAVLAVILLLSAGYLIFMDIPPVTLSWETASEVGTAGFNIYRADIGSEQFSQVNEGMIPAEGDEMLGAAYSYDDHNVKPAKRYLYRIEEVEWDGTTHLYPETEMVRAGLTRVWRQLEGVILCILAVILLRQGIKKK